MNTNVSYIIFAESNDTNQRRQTYRMSPKFETRSEAENYMELLAGSFAGNPRFYIVDLPPRAKLMNRGFIKPAFSASMTNQVPAI